MSATAVAAPTGSPGPREKSSAGRVAVRSLGEVAITFGVVVMLLVVYQLFYTNLEANRAQDAIKDGLREFWTQRIAEGKPVKGGAFGVMYIERLGKSWEKPLVEGAKTALPGRVGNFAVAAHRATHGEPFAYLDRMRPKDKVVVETKDRWYVYTIDKMPCADPDNPAWKLVDPSYTEVVLPTPERPGVKPTEKRITFVTCNPRWGSTTRLIVYGTLTKTYTKPGPLPAELAYTAKGA